MNSAMDNNTKPRIGAYSGNERLIDPTFQEPDGDTADMQKMWLEEIPNDPDFLEEIKKRYEDYRKILKLSGDPDQFIAHLVGESHIDIAWLWRFEQTRKKAAVTLRKAIFHAKRFPGKYCYALSEPILLQWVKEDDPKLFAQVQETVKAGGIELVGGSYVEPDCMMPTAEAFIRQRLYGMRFYRDHFSVLPEVEWFLDSFGYNWSLPQILVKTGAKYFWTSKITWNMNTVFPFVNFWWEGVDGTRLLTCNFHMAYGALSSWGLYEVGRRPLKKGTTYFGNYERNYEDIGDAVSDTEICPHFGVFFGRGDGGHGPTYQEVAEANGLAACGPLFIWSRVRTFFGEVEKWSSRFPIWQDELYLENHQGTFSVHAEVKRNNRFFENHLCATETLASLVSLGVNKKDVYPLAKLESLWKTLLKNQFHDVLPGSSIPEVYDDTYEDWKSGKAEIDTLQERISAHVQAVSGCQIVAFNNLSWHRSDRVFIPASQVQGRVILDENGKPPPAVVEFFGPKPQKVPAQPVAAEPDDWIDARPAGYWVVADFMPLSFTPGKLSVNIMSQEPVAGNDSFLDNGITRVTLDQKTGGIASLTSKAVLQMPAVPNLVQGGMNNLTEAFEDKSKAWPAWNLTPEYWKYPIKINNAQGVTCTIREQGPVFTTIAVTRAFGKGKDQSPVTQLYTLFKGRPEVYCEYLADWKQPKVMLKVGIDTTTDATRCTADIGGGAILRSTVPQTPADKARHEKICHKYFDVSAPDDAWGLATLNEGKYAFDATGGRTRLTMLRSPDYPGPAGESWVHKERRIRKEKYGTEPPTYSGLGPFRCKYAYLPHAGSALQFPDGKPNPAVKRAAEEFNNPIVILKVDAQKRSKENYNADGTALLYVTAPNVVVSSIKTNEWTPGRSFIIHIVEALGKPAEGDIAFHASLASRIAQVREVDLLERADGSVKSVDLPMQGGIIHLSIKRFEIKALEIILK